MEPTPTPTCPADMDSISCGDAMMINTTCLSCGQPKPLEENTMMAPKVICDGDGPPRLFMVNDANPWKRRITSHHA